MNIDLPKFHETFNPILIILKEGQILHHRELLDAVIKKFYSDLPKELLEEKTKSGEILLENRIAWGKSYLKKGGFVHYPKRGHVQITEKGIKSLDTKLNLKDIENESGIFDFYKEEKSKVIEPTTSIDNSPEDLITAGFHQLDSQLKSELLEKLKLLNPYFFEKVILILLKRMGYGDFIETSKSSDGGIDGIINEDKLGLEKIYIQAKRYTSNKVNELEIRNFIGAMSGDTRKGVFVTTSDFGKKAIKKAADAHHTIILINGEKLASLMHEYNVGVQVKEIYEVKEFDMDFFEGEE
jgi:restriction system protein